MLNKAFDPDHREDTADKAEFGVLWTPETLKPKEYFMKPKAIRKRIREIERELEKPCLCFEQPCEHVDLDRERLRLQTELNNRAGRKHDADCYYSGEKFVDVPRTDELCGCGISKTELEEALAQTRAELDECRADAKSLNPEEPPLGSFVRFGVMYQIPGRTYTYGALRVKDKWYVTGNVRGFTSGTWSELCNVIRTTDIGIDAYRGGKLTFEVGRFGG